MYDFPWRVWSRGVIYFLLFFSSGSTFSLFQCRRNKHINIIQREPQDRESLPTCCSKPEDKLKASQTTQRLFQLDKPDTLSSESSVSRRRLKHGNTHGQRIKAKKRLRF